MVRVEMPFPNTGITLPMNICLLKFELQNEQYMPVAGRANSIEALGKLTVGMGEKTARAAMNRRRQRRHDNHLLAGHDAAASRQSWKLPQNDHCTHTVNVNWKLAPPPTNVPFGLMRTFVIDGEVVSQPVVGLNVGVTP